MLDDGKVSFELELAVTEDMARWKVPRDSVAQVRAAGLLAAITVDIRAGSSPETLAPGDHIRGVGRSSVFAAFSDTANTMRELTLTGLKPLIENLNRYVSVFGGLLELRGGPLIENLSVLSAELAGRAPQVIDDFLQTTRELRLVSERLQVTLSEETSAKLGSVLDNVLSASEDLARLTGNARGQLGIILSDDMTARVQRVMGNVDTAAAQIAVAGERIDRMVSEGNAQRVDSMLRNADEASAGARALVGAERQSRVDAILASADRAAVGLDALISDTREQVRGLLRPQTVQRFDTALVNISSAAATVARLSEHLDQRVDEVLTPQMSAKLKRTLENFSLAAANVATLTRGLEHSRGDLEALLVALRAMAEDNRIDVRASVLDLRHGLDVVAQHIDAVAQNLEDSSRNMVEFSRRLKANPGLLLRGGGPSPDTGRVPSGG